MTLVEFLLARIAEDEARQGHARALPRYGSPWGSDIITATAYAAHPDYRAEWRP